MRNAKKELIEALGKNLRIKAATIDCNNKIYILKVGYSNQEFECFLKDLNFEYDSSYGSQHLYGTVWLENNSWLERGEYDGLEWWDLKELPLIPDCLK